MEILQGILELFGGLLGLYPLACSSTTLEPSETPADLSAQSDSYEVAPACKEMETDLLLNFTVMQSRIKYFVDKCDDFCRKSSKSYNDALCKCFDPVHARSQKPFEHYYTCTQEHGFNVEDDPTW